MRNRLAKVRQLLAAGWTNEFYWTDASGKPVEPEVATHFCLAGAVAFVTHDRRGGVGFSKQSQELFRAIQPHLPPSHAKDEYALRACLRFNDSHTQQEVLDAIDKAIAHSNT